LVELTGIGPVAFSFANEEISRGNTFLLDLFHLFLFHCCSKTIAINSAGVHLASAGSYLRV
jgi:hypothetical protein